MISSIQSGVSAYAATAAQATAPVQKPARSSAPAKGDAAPQDTVQISPAALAAAQNLLGGTKADVNHDGD
jgi:hypothetical protein